MTSRRSDDQAPRSVARDARGSSPAEDVARLLDELYYAVETRESIVTHRRVRRGPDRIIAVPDIRPHRTHGPGLLAQLGVIAATGDRGHVVAGAAVPHRSPGWDEDGALAPLSNSGRPGSAEPVTEAWHIAREIDQAVDELVEQLRAEGHRGGLVDIALADERVGARIVARLRGLVARARIAADYDAPIVPLRDVCCPDCGGELRVRQDASSAVWCTGSWIVEGPAPRGEPWPVRAFCGARWPRGAWVALLEDLDPDGAVEAPRNDHSPAQTPPRPLVHDPADVGEVPDVLAGLVHQPQPERTV
ncbi:hypothetical protein [Actinomadura miaoliensis]|uniref:Uncharacterized protein n=1 Tax=Actinomadura miaoliensis TaxID=430685 RepID=A0ABP7V500_9ACTN